jgi:hypothetical protein
LKQFLMNLMESRAKQIMVTLKIATEFILTCPARPGPNIVFFGKIHWNILSGKSRNLSLKLLFSTKMMEFDTNTDFSHEFRNSDSSRIREDLEEDVDELYLSLFFGAGRLGAAYYNVSDGVLYTMNDMADPAPKHKLVMSILSQLNPRHLLVSTRHGETFGNVASVLNQSKANNSSTATSTLLADTSFAEMETCNQANDSLYNVNVVILPGKVRSYSCRL